MITTERSRVSTLSEYLGMSATDYVARGLAIKRAVELGGTEVGAGGAAPRVEYTSPTPLPTTKPKRIFSAKTKKEFSE